MLVPTIDILVALMILTVVGAVASIIGAVVYRRLSREVEGEWGGSNFREVDLRVLLREGRLTQEEYDRAVRSPLMRSMEAAREGSSEGSERGTDGEGDDENADSA